MTAQTDVSSPSAVTELTRYKNVISTSLPCNSRSACSYIRGDRDVPLEAGETLLSPQLNGVSLQPTALPRPKPLLLQQVYKLLPSHEHIVKCISNCRRGLESWIDLLTPYTTTRTYKQHSTIAHLCNLQFTVTHTLGFSVFTSRILVTELKQTHCD
jgi:hypothetical protein